VFVVVVVAVEPLQQFIQIQTRSDSNHGRGMNFKTLGWSKVHVPTTFSSGSAWLKILVVALE
jgi:hypothetical protein